MTCANVQVPLVARPDAAGSASVPKHGYALLLDIEKFAGVRLGPGTLYGAIGRLEERGLIKPLATDGRLQRLDASVCQPESRGADT